MSLTIKNSNRSIKRSIETQKNAQPFLPKRSMRSLKCKEKKRKEIKTKEEDVEDVEAVEDVEDVEFANQFNDSMNISTKRRRVDDV